MNWVDLVIIVAGLAFAAFGLMNGLIRMAFSTVGLVGGIVLAGRFYQSLAEVLSPTGASWSGVAAFAIIVIVTLVVANIVGSVIKKVVSLLLLGWIDKVFGFILGALTGTMLCAALLTIATKYFPSVIEDTLSQSVMAKFVMEQFPLLLGLLPEDFDFIRNFFQENGELPLDKLTKVLP